jgi:uncharacterized protein with gpF-like domain
MDSSRLSHMLALIERIWQQVREEPRIALHRLPFSWDELEQRYEAMKRSIILELEKAQTTVEEGDVEKGKREILIAISILIWIGLVLAFYDALQASCVLFPHKERKQTGYDLAALLEQLHKLLPQDGTK